MFFWALGSCPRDGPDLGHLQALLFLVKHPSGTASVLPQTPAFYTWVLTVTCSLSFPVTLPRAWVWLHGDIKGSELRVEYQNSPTLTP